MAIFKNAENITITVRNTDIVACKTYKEVAEQVIMESINGDLTLNSVDTITLQGGIPDTYLINSQSNQLKKFLIHFRRPSTYKGEFGFDWLKDEYIYPIDLVGNIKKELCLDTNKLKDEYKNKDVLNPITPYGKDYYCSWLNLLKNQEVQLNIELEEIEQLDHKDNAEIIFESSNPDVIEIIPNKLSLKDLISGGLVKKNLGGTNVRKYYSTANPIKIKNNGFLSQDCQIKVFAELNKIKKEVGKLMIIKNDEESEYTINIYINKSYLIDDNNYGKSKIDTQLRKIGGISALEKYLNENSLNQSSIQVKLNYIDDVKIKKNSLLQASNQGKYKDMIDINTMNINNDINYKKYIFDKLKSNVTSKRGIILTLAAFLSNKNVGGSSPISPLEANHGLIFLSNLDDLQTYAHELGHILGLTHSFLDSNLSYEQELKNTEYNIKKTNSDIIANVSNLQKLKKLQEDLKDYQDLLIVQKNNPHKFINGKTDNIMDYNNNTGLSFFKWQWKIMRDEAKNYYHQ